MGNRYQRQTCWKFALIPWRGHMTAQFEDPTGRMNARSANNCHPREERGEDAAESLAIVLRTGLWGEGRDEGDRGGGRVNGRARGVGVELSRPAARGVIPGGLPSIGRNAGARLAATKY